MTACSEYEFVTRLLELVLDTCMWRECEVTSAWRNAILLPIPHKDYLRDCDNWRRFLMLFGR